MKTKILGKKIHGNCTTASSARMLLMKEKYFYNKLCHKSLDLKLEPYFVIITLYGHNAPVCIKATNFTTLKIERN